jgi:HK97 gp10 family phage protein
MSGKVEVKIVGLPELDRLLKRMGEQGIALVETAVTTGAQKVRNEAATRAPRKAGQLRRSLITQTTIRTATRVEVAVATNVPYARIHEYGGEIKHPGGTPYVPWGGAGGPFGGAVKFLKKDGSYPAGVRFTKPHIIKMPARPYLRPALEAKRAEAIAAIEKVLAALVRNAK